MPDLHRHWVAHQRKPVPEPDRDRDAPDPRVDDEPRRHTRLRERLLPFQPVARAGCRARERSLVRLAARPPLAALTRSDSADCRLLTAEC